MDRKTFLRNSALAALSLPIMSFADQHSPKETKMKKLCTACGTQFPESYQKDLCAICTEERQYIPATGQSWTTHENLLKTHKIRIVKINENLYEIVITPKFAIGQRAFLVLSKEGNILWDCIPLLDQNIIDFINQKGGIKAIAISHPHYYSNMNDWAQQFDCPIYIHNRDKDYISDHGKYIRLWSDKSLQLWDNISIENIGGHFDGSSVLLSRNLSKEGTLLCGDTMYLSPSMKHFAIMYSYPNRMPLPKSEILRIKDRLNELNFDTVYGFYSYQNLTTDVKKILDNSIKRYLG